MPERTESSTLATNVEAARAYAERKRNPQPSSPTTIGRGVIGITNNGLPMPNRDPWQNPAVIEILAANNPVDDDPEDELAWQRDALCSQTDPEAFFPEKGGSTRMAKKICQMCDAKVDCLDYALANDERFGIWGGLSERERRKLQKRLKAA